MSIWSQIKFLFARYAHITISISFFEVGFLLILLTLCLLFRFSRLGLIVGFLFAFRWGWIFLRETFIINTTSPDYFWAVVYLFLGVTSVGLFTLNFFNRPAPD